MSPDSFNTEPSPVFVGQLLHCRMTMLGLTKPDLVKRWGYSNVGKGLRRLHQIAEHGYQPTLDQLFGLASALQVSIEELRDAIDTTRLNKETQIAAARDAVFKPHGYLLGERSRPSQITFFAVTGGWDRWCRVEFDTSRPPITYIKQALAVVRATPHIPFLGATQGVIINFSVQRAVIFDVAGNPVEVLREAYVPGRVHVRIGGREMPAAVAARRPGFGA